jgi:hypothetical protein
MNTHLATSPSRNFDLSDPELRRAAGRTDTLDKQARHQRATAARAASVRRKRIDPTTCDRDYSTAELEFLTAIQAYKVSSGRNFPTWSEVLEVLRNLGYEKSEVSR